MSGIDNRVVEMQFDNAQFEKGIKTTTDSLKNLEKGLDLKGATKGLDAVNAASKNFSLDSIAKGVETVASRFTALGIAGVTALVNITNRAVNAGLQLVKSFTVKPIIDGLHEYETQINSIQTILANTQSKGTTLDQVNGALAELNKYADLTIYNFTQMTDSVGRFTAAGVDLKTSVAAIKGISNVAALSGSNAQQASTAMYQLSQAIASGTVRLQDWMSVENAGMGGQAFQKALIRTAKIHGVEVDAMIKKNGSFRNSLQEGWLSAKIMNETLNQFTGDLSDAQLKRQGYSAKDIKDIQAMAKAANQSATVVKTFSGLMDTLREAVGSGWAQTWQLVIGDFGEAKKLWSGVSSVLGDMVAASSNARNNMLKDWAKLGGRTAIINAIGNAFNALLAVIKPITTAFKNVFPAVTGKQLADISKKIEEFTKKLMISKDTAKTMQAVFTGVFSILKVGFELAWSVAKIFFTGIAAIGKVVGALLGFLTPLFSGFDQTASGVQNTTKSFSDFSTTVSGVINKAIQPLVDWINRLVEGFKELVDGVKLDGFGQRVQDAFGPLAVFGEIVVKIWTKLANIFSQVVNAIATGAVKIGEVLGNIGTAISNSLNSGTFDSVLSAVNTGLFGALVLAIRGFLPKLGGALEDGIKGELSLNLFGQFKEIFGSVTDTLSAMQTKLKAEALLKIAQAIGLMAAAVIGLSLIDTGKAAISIGLMTGMFAQLIGTLAVLTKMDLASVGKIAVLATTMVLVGASMAIASVGIIIMVGALKLAATLSWDEIGRGLVAVGGALAILAIGLTAMDASLPGAAALVVASLGLIALGVALKIMATLSWDDIGRGMATLGASLAILAVGLTLMTGSIVGAAALVVASVGLIALATALKIMSTLSWDDIGRGMAVLGASLAILAVGLTLMMASLPGAAALVVASAALIILGGALKILATLSWDDIGRGLTALGGALLILAIGLTAMIVALPGAAALTVASTALAILVPVLAALGSMSWGTIGTGLGAMAAALGILAIAGIALLPAIPGLVGLGVAAVLIGAGALAAGVGISAFATGLTLLAAAGTAGATALKSAVLIIIGLIPEALTALAQGLIDFALTIADGADQFLGAFTALLETALTAIDKEGPHIIDTLWNLILKLANKTADGAPKLLDAGLRLIVGLLNGIAKRTGDIIEAGANIVIAVLNGIGKQGRRIADAGFKMVIDLVNGISDSIDQHSEEMGHAGGRLASSIIRGMVNGIGAGIGDVVRAAQNMAGNALDAAKNFLKINSPSKKFIVVGASTTEGFVKGITTTTHTVADAAVNMASAAIDSAKNTLDINSPSKEFVKIGQFVTQGFVQGVRGGEANVKATFDYLKQMLADFMSEANQRVKDAKDALNKEKQDLKDRDRQIADNKKDIAYKQKQIDAAKAYNKTHKDHKKSLDALYRSMDKLKQKQKDLAAARKKDVQALKDAQATYNTVVAENKKVAAERTVLYTDPEVTEAKRAKAIQVANKKNRDKLASDIKKEKAKVAADDKKIADKKAQIAKATKEHKSTKKLQQDLKKLTDTRKKDVATLKKSQTALKNAPSADPKKDLDNAKKTLAARDKQIAQTKVNLALAKKKLEADKKAAGKSISKAEAKKIAADQAAVKKLTKTLGVQTKARKSEAAAVSKAATAYGRMPTGDAKKDLDQANARIASSNKAIKQTKDQIELAKKKLAADKKAAGKNISKKEAAKLKADQKAIDALNKKLKTQTAYRQKDIDIANHAKKVISDTKKHDDFVAKQNQLDSLGKKYDELTAKLEDATQAYDDLVKAKADYDASVKDSFNNMQDITKETDLKTYMSDLQKQIQDTKDFALKLETLRSMGLNDTLYKQLVAKGTDAIPFMDQLLASGTEGVKQFDDLQAQLDAAAGDLGKTAADEMYDAGINAAKGLVEGLKTQRADIDKEMQDIAKAMVDTIKKELGIKSPSREMMKLGDFATQGLVKGLKIQSSAVSSTAKALGTTTLDSLRKTLSSSTTNMFDSLSMDPTIRPVLDLSGVENEAKKLDGMIKPQSLTVDSSYNSAVAAKSAYTATVAESTTNANADRVRDVTFIQNNNSPKALPQAEIYRQTKNQISQAKEKLTT